MIAYKYITLVLILIFLTSCTSTISLSTPEVTRSIMVRPTNIVTPTQSGPTQPTALINERLNAVVSSYRDLGNYPFTEKQLANLRQSVELVQISDKKMQLTRSYWLISETKLTELQEPELAEMLGYIPLAYSEDGFNWKASGLKDTTDLPLGAQFDQLENGSAEVIGANFDTAVVTSEWGSTMFGGKSIFDFITINQDGSVILNPDKLGWGGNEDYQMSEALKFVKGSTKDIDKSGRGRRIYLSHLIYPGHSPVDFNKLTRDQAISVIQQYITAIVDKYKNKVFAYSVVNEFGQNDDLWKIIGPDYIDIAFKAVRDADPTALTILNIQENEVNRGEVRIEGRTIAEETRLIAERLKSKGLIDFVGAECHIELFPLSPHDETLEEIKNTFSSYPVPVIITELDVNMQEYANKPDAYLIQAQKLKTLLQAASDSGSVKMINLWGDFPDDKSFPTVIIGDQNANPGPWAASWKEKPFFFEMSASLFKNYVASNFSQ